MTADFLAPDRRFDLIARLEWVMRRHLDELPDTLVAALRASGIACDRATQPQMLVDRLRGDQPEFRAAS